MTRRFYSFIILAFLSVQIGFGQDALLLTNGKVKQLKANVVYFDYEDVLYQNSRQKEKMDAFLEKARSRQQKKESNTKWIAKQAKKAAKVEQKRNAQKTRIAEAKQQLELEIEKKTKAELAPAEFEKWKSRQLADIKSMEQQFVLDSTVQAQLAEAKVERKEGAIRRRFTNRISRTLVFSIQRADGTEEVVYSADTLGFLMDGTTDVEYNVAEMRMYIKGRQDGRKHSFHDVYIGAGVGLLSGLLFTYTLDMFYAPIPPAICVAVMAGLRKVKPSAKLELTKALLQSDPYMDGYYRSAKGRKILAFTIGAVGGLGVGITTAVLTSPLLRN